MVCCVGPEGPRRKTCGLEAEEVIRTMAELDAGFTEVMLMLRQAADCQAVSCPVRIDALPQPRSVHELSELGKKDPTGHDLLPAGSQ
jgi:hypothetical protein